MYKYACSVDWSISYIRETSRQILIRNADHKGKDKRSAIFDHLFNYIPCQNLNIENKFTVLKRRAQGDLYNLELMIIEEVKPKLNTQIVETKMRIIYFFLIFNN